MKQVALLALAIGVIGSNSLALSPMAAAVAADFPTTRAADVMTASALYGAGVAVSALLLAPSIDRHDTGRHLVWALAVLAAALALSSLAPSIVWLSGFQFLAGLAAGVALPAIYKLAAIIAPEGRESETLGWVLTGWTISMVAGVSASAWAAEAIGWRSVYLVLATLAGGITLAVAMLRPKEEDRGDGTSGSLLAAISTPGLAGGLLVVIAYMTAFYGTYAYLGAHGSDLGLSTGRVGLLTMAYGVGFGLAAPLDRFIDRLGARDAAAPVFAALIVVYLAIAAAADAFGTLIALSLFWGVVNHLGLNIALLRLRGLAPDRQGAILGLYSFVTYAAMFLGTLAFRPVFERFGLAGCALAAAAILIPSALEAAYLRRRKGSV